MLRGRKGDCRPAGDNERGALVCRLATGKSPQVYEPSDNQQARWDARAACLPRAEKLSTARRPEIATATADARWGAKS